MPRKPRFYLPDVPAHVIQRGNNRQAVFFCDDDCRAYLTWLREGAARHGCAIHAYALMTNHVHLLVTPETRDAISRTMQYVGRHYVIYVNTQYGRSGTLWEGRHKGSIISSEAYLLACSRYIELNPVRAGMVAAPGDYRWSSYGANAGGKSCSLLKHHPLYLALGDSPESRQRAYRDLFRGAPGSEELDAIRSAVQTGTPLGSDRFRAQIEAALKCKVGQARRGRPARRVG
jgi:putative transposase